MASNSSPNTLLHVPGVAPAAGLADDVLLVGAGPMALTGLEIADRLAGHGIGVTVVDPRWTKPVDEALIGAARRHRLVATVEDNGRVGGFGDAVARLLRDHDPVTAGGTEERLVDRLGPARVHHGDADAVIGQPVRDLEPGQRHRAGPGEQDVLGQARGGGLQHVHAAELGDGLDLAAHVALGEPDHGRPVGHLDRLVE